jgi:hypothetical protein
MLACQEHKHVHAWKQLVLMQAPPEHRCVQAGFEVPQELRLAGHDFGPAVRYPGIFLKVLHGTAAIIRRTQLQGAAGQVQSAA